MPASTSPRPRNAADTPLLSTPPDLRPSDNHTAGFCSIRRHAVQQGLIPFRPITYESPVTDTAAEAPKPVRSDRHRCARRGGAAPRRRDRLPLVRAGLLPDLPHAARPRRRRLGRRRHHPDHARDRLRGQAGRADAGGARPDGRLDRHTRLHPCAVLRLRLRGRAGREVGHRLEPLLDRLRSGRVGVGDADRHRLRRARARADRPGRPAVRARVARGRHGGSSGCSRSSASTPRS